MPTAASGGLVYSTDHGRMCPGCRQPVAACRCAASAGAPKPGDGSVRVAREVKGRRGKAVTVVRGLPLDAATLDALARRLKAACGSGGTAKDGVLEVQGDHRERVAAMLRADGWMVKVAG